MLMASSQSVQVGNIYKQSGSSGREPICLIRSRDYTGHMAYYFLKVDPFKLRQFEKIADSGQYFDLEAYGEIIVSGYGEEVPASVLERMRRNYGWQS